MGHLLQVNSHLSQVLSALRASLIAQLADTLDRIVIVRCVLTEPLGIADQFGETGSGRLHGVSSHDTGVRIPLRSRAYRGLECLVLPTIGGLALVGQLGDKRPSLHLLFVLGFGLIVVTGARIITHVLVVIATRCDAHAQTHHEDG